MNYSELQEKTTEELTALLTTLRDEVRVLRFQIASSQLKDVRALRARKKTIARVLTLLSSGR